MEAITAGLLTLYLYMYKEYIKTFLLLPSIVPEKVGVHKKAKIKK
jgi:hypothetical protein